MVDEGYVAGLHARLNGDVAAMKLFKGGKEMGDSFEDDTLALLQYSSTIETRL
jgi:hypothetical protein